MGSESGVQEEILSPTGRLAVDTFIPPMLAQN